MATLTLSETADQLRESLRDYIEATYHISDEQLVFQRRQLLDTPGVIHQPAYIESTPRYRLGKPFAELALPAAAEKILGIGVTAQHDGYPLLNDPPYEHQAQSLTAVLSRGHSLMVTTGTGSGKTECFLLPILGRLAMEASDSPETFGAPGIRAILLYPMNALVNDQLGRLRRLFGHPDIRNQFEAWAGRPLRFARYTSRTLYPGVRTAKRDQQRLKPIGKYFVNILREASGGPSGEPKRRLHEELLRRGKWPAKPDLLAWYGSDGDRWQDKNGKFQRCVTLPSDPELLTRHEVLEAAPDVLVTNYSMLEYMLMRPLERPIFDQTRAWLEQSTLPFVLVVDEAHLYRGASGTEVALLLRRLRDRLGIGSDRLQVICTSASFDDTARATAFAARLTGTDLQSMESVRGDLWLEPKEDGGSVSEAEALSQIDLDEFYRSDDEVRLTALQEFLSQRGATSKDPRIALFEALRGYPPMSRLKNLTMQQPCRVDEVGGVIFPGATALVAARAATVLVGLASFARSPSAPDGPGLLPSRLHAFFRGLPGLWVCADADCAELRTDERGGPTGRLYGQPRDRCACGARVFELFTCRNCGSAYLRGYTDSLENPRFLWSEGGRDLLTPTGRVDALEPIDVLLGQAPVGSSARPVELDVETGRIDSVVQGSRGRVVFLPPTGTQTEEGGRTDSGIFNPCGVCAHLGRFGRSPVQDHQTKGDEPFQALVTRQVEAQPETTPPTDFAPMGGRKVLVFSDSRQTAARLAPNLQTYTTRDAVRPLLLYGLRLLETSAPKFGALSLGDAYFAILLACVHLRVQLRPITRADENFERHVTEVRRSLARGLLDEPDELKELAYEVRTWRPPEALLRAVLEVVGSPYYGLRSLALATLAERHKAGFIEGLPAVDGLPTDLTERRALVRLWLDAWRSLWFSTMPSSLSELSAQPETGRFPVRMKRLLSASAFKSFDSRWLPLFLDEFGEPRGNKYLLKADRVRLEIGGVWAYCSACRTTQRPRPAGTTCAYCGQAAVTSLDPEGDRVFRARKNYYRRAAIQALERGEAPSSIVAAEHTAQLNTAQAEDVFSRAEEHELLFQDVDLGEGKPAIDVLSCTTTMEVGIDIGALSGVALRNMPPSRANYQQRSGRAGRRGRAVATVTSFAGSDSHDDHCFQAPDEVIRGPVNDPELALDNVQIARRHLAAFVIQQYLADRLPNLPDQSASAEVPSAYGSQLFEVLGSVEDFLDDGSVLSKKDFRTWLESHRGALAARAESWLPGELGLSLEALRDAILVVADEVDEAVKGELGSSHVKSDRSQVVPLDGVEIQDEVDEDAGRTAVTGSLLDRLLYKGVLPRYAFPTDVATFHVFDANESTLFRPVFQYSPSQGLPVALSQYAPGKTVWVDGREWRSGAIYSPMLSDRSDAWTRRRWYLECSVCRYAKTEEQDAASRRERRRCDACGTADSLGPAMGWFRPPGFAHPYYLDENTSPDDEPPPSYATRAKLTAPAPSDSSAWSVVNERIRTCFQRATLLVTNAGPDDDGYTYCVKCGLIEPSATTHPTVTDGHRKPYPEKGSALCSGGATARGVVLGTDFLADVLLISLLVDAPLTLRPQFDATRVALRTISEAVTATACEMLGIDPSELRAEFRPALTPRGQHGTEAEIYLYDTLAGGAGFARHAGELGRDLYDRTLQRLDSCPADCDSSCYRCLRSYKNKFEHDLLDRHLGAGLLRYVLTSETPSLAPERAEASTTALFNDLVAQGMPGLAVERGARVEVAGFGALQAPILATQGLSRTAIVLHLPFAPSVAVHPDWTAPAEFGFSTKVLLVDELVVRRNLPWATATVLKQLGFGDE